MRLRQIIRRPCGSTVTGLDHLPPVLQRVYAGRGIQSSEVLDYRLSDLLHFEALLGIEQAVHVLVRHIQAQNRLLIVGDFDADGATSTALAVSALRAMGAQQVDYLVPNRFEYGYGLTPEIVQVAKETKRPDLIITVDNGISSNEGVLAAHAMGIQVLITDHHLPPPQLPPAAAIVNPQQVGDKFLSKNLAGVGVIFYVMLALRQSLKSQGWFESIGKPVPVMRDFLDLVALGTVADMVLLDRNNRILVQHGIAQIRAGHARPGIRALARVASCSVSGLVSSDLGFMLAPRLNAAGRLSDMSLGIECLLSDQEKQALDLAQQLDQLNKERRLIEQSMHLQAMHILDKISGFESDLAGICLFDAQWHQGVIGIVAGRIKERLYRPTIVFAPSSDANELKGSARSIPGIHIRDLLTKIATQYPTLIRRFGGHAMAAGLSIEQKDYALFSEVFEKEARIQLENLSELDVLTTDGELLPEELNLTVANSVREAGPWGQGFPEPLFDGQFQIFTQRLVAQKHVQMSLGLPQLSKPIQGILFNTDLAHWPNPRVSKVHAAYRLSVNTYQGRTEPQLIIESLTNLS